MNNNNANRSSTVTVQLLSEASQEDALLLYPKPYDDWLTQCTEIDSNHLATTELLTASNSPQQAYVGMASASTPLPTIRYSFTPCSGKQPPKAFWEIQANRYTTASPELIQETQTLCHQLPATSAKIRQLIDQAATLFGYSHMEEEERFNFAHDVVPSICGTAKGSCVDINTYLIAAARSLDIPVQYIAGYWFHPDKTATNDMHCWLAFLAEGETVFWDLAHHLKWGVSKLSPGLNPAGGRRIPMSFGRGIQFDTPYGEVEISHFSEPVWILPNGQIEAANILITIKE